MFLSIRLDNVNPQDIHALRDILGSINPDKVDRMKAIGAVRILTTLQRALSESGDQIVEAMIPGYQATTRNSQTGKVGIGLGIGLGPSGNGPGGSGVMTRDQEDFMGIRRPASKGFI